ncbi:hypothetical protein [Aquitalea sp. USM4]|uniref:hypothetical protein n=1 Tax=Aquitalea sp. USM4 TaxID=1590041 RepID=UPI001040D00B|nr:hypothetical protein [Aquitalea sp. USM4]QBJ80500.1 hypothetical protein DKK66_19825 [Aquitalea sp. USM4]
MLPHNVQEDQIMSAGMTASEAVVKATPALGLSVWAHWGPTLQEVSALLGICYSILMISFLLIDRFKRKRPTRRK